MSTTTRQVLWLQVWGLAAVQGAIALTWVIYNLYLKQLLTSFGFPETLATVLLIIENILAALMEPLMGGFSDQAQRWVGSRFPFIATGVVLASACFILIPTVLIFGTSQGPARLLLPGILIAWALAMTIFRSPALSLLGRYAFGTNLPRAASILTLVGGVAGAMGPLANQFILGLGPLFAFSIGSVTLLLAATALRMVDPNRKIQAEASPPVPELEIVEIKDLRNSQESPITPPAPSPQSFLSLARNLAIVFGAGLGVSLGFRLLMNNFPKVLETQVPDANRGFVLGGIFIALALSAIPCGSLATRMGNRRAMVIGLGAMAAFCGLMATCHNTWMAGGIAIALGSSLSLVSNGTIPFALSMVPSDRGGLGTGIYFSGGAVAGSLFGAFFGSSGFFSPSVGAFSGAIAFLLAGGFVLISSLLRLDLKNQAP